MSEKNKLDCLVKIINDKYRANEKKIAAWKADSRKDREHSEWIWRALVTSMATMGNSRGLDVVKNNGFFANSEQDGTLPLPENEYSYECLVKQEDKQIYDVLMKVFNKIKFGRLKSEWLVKDIRIIQKHGGPSAISCKINGMKSAQERIDFMIGFHGIGQKYSRNIYMDVADDVVSNVAAIDIRLFTILKHVDGSLTYPINKIIYNRAQGMVHELAKETKLDMWTVDRIMYNYYSDICSGLGIKQSKVKKPSPLAGPCAARWRKWAE